MSINKYFFLISLLISNFLFAQDAKPIKNDSLKKIKLEKSRDAFLDKLPKPFNWTNDYENVFTDDEEVFLNEQISLFERKTDFEIAIITLDTLSVSKDDFDRLTLDISNKWGIGKTKKDNGILIAISKGHRRIRIQNGDGIVPIISNKETQKIIENTIIPNFKNGNYFEGTRDSIFVLMELLQKG